MKLATMTLESPLGPIALVASDGALDGIYLPGETHLPPGAHGAEPADDPLLADAARQLAEYFAGRRRQFDLRLGPRGTPFQQTVWLALRDIPFGATCSYGDIARAVGRPTASRAVGAANGRNPLPIVVPCHRVIGQNGSLTGYGGGLPIKRWLLDFEAGVISKPG